MVMETESSFGNWIKRRRRALDLTQQALAQRVGCSMATIVKIEADERRPSRQMAELLARYLEIPADQRERFLKVARKERAVDSLVGFSGSDQSLSPPKFHIQNTSAPLIGREFEIAEVTRLIQDSRCRLLTLTGTGGIGKTRLALEGGIQTQAEFEHGGMFINLAPLTGRDQIVTAIADALGIVLYTASDRSMQLIAHLREKEFVLVLDNFEHLLDQAECVVLPSDLLQGAPLLKLVVTSREPLQLASEWVFDVKGLPVPRGDELDSLASSSAVKLFVQRARQTLTGFELQAADRAAVRQICQLVDGVPLAIELAAGWVRTLTCAEIAREIQSNIGFLTSTSRDITERHRSIRATFDYSWKLLAPEEQLVLRRLTVFQGGFTREAAEQVAGASLPVLSALVSKSLLHRIDSGRYDMHELVRQYSVEYLVNNEAEHVATRDRHGEYYTALLKRRGEAFKGVDQPIVAAELAAEIANLRQAWRWTGERGQAVQVGQAADTFFWLYESRCDCREGVPLFGYVAQKLEADQVSETDAASGWDEMRLLTQARVMAYQGFFCLRQGLHPQSREVLERSLAVLRSISESGSPAARDALSNTLAFLGMLNASLGDYERGDRFLNEGLELKRASQDGWGMAFCLRQLGLLGYYQGAHEKAHRLLTEGLELSRELGNPWAIAYSLDFLSMAAYGQGAYAEAERLLHEGLALSRQVGDRFTIAYALNGLGLVKKALGDLEGARQLLEDSIAIWRDIGDQESLAKSLYNLGDALLGTDHQPEAREYFLESLLVARKAQLAPVMLGALLGCAVLQAEAGQIESALHMLICIKDHPASIQFVRARAENLFVQLQAKRSAEQMESIRTVASVKSLDVLVQETLASFSPV